MPSAPTGTSLDHAAFLAAFERVAQRLVKPPFDYAATGDRYESIPFLRERKYGDLPETLEELFEDSIDDVAIANFVTLLVMRELGVTGGAPVTHELFTYYPGDLEVKGNLGYEKPVFVLGDLVVDEDRFESSPLLVAGNVRTKRMFLGSETSRS